MKIYPGHGTLMSMRNDASSGVPLRLDFTKRMTLGRFGQNLGQCRFPKCVLDQRQGIVESLMQWTQANTVRRQAERTFSNSANRFHRIDDIQNG